MGKITIPSGQIEKLQLSIISKKIIVLIAVFGCFSANLVIAQSVSMTDQRVAGLPCAICAPDGWEVDFGTPDSGNVTAPANDGANGQGATTGGGASWVAPGFTPVDNPLPAAILELDLPPNGHENWLSLRDLGTGGSEERVKTLVTDLIVGRDYEIFVYTLTARTHGDGFSANPSPPSFPYSGAYNDSFRYTIGDPPSAPIEVNPITQDAWGTSRFRFTTDEVSKVLTFLPGDNSALVPGGSLYSAESVQVSVSLNAINLIPLALDDSETVIQGDVAMVDILNNDDEDGVLDISTIDLDPLTPGVQQSFMSANGNWSVDNAGIVAFVPNDPTFSGFETIDYVVNDDFTLDGTLYGSTSNIASIKVVVLEDTDMDGVANGDDLDDDNDGILDDLECPFVVPTGGAVQSDAIVYTTLGGKQVFTIGGNTNGLGFSETGWDVAVTGTGASIQSELNLTSTTFSNGTVSGSNDAADPVANPYSVFPTNNGAWASGSDTRTLGVNPGTANLEIDQSLVFSTFINFNTPVYAFGFDLIDFNDHGTGLFTDTWEVFVDGVLVYQLGPELSIDAGTTGPFPVFSDQGVPLGNVTQGENTENFIGFIGREAVGQVEIRRTSIYDNSNPLATGTDFHGIDSFRFTTDAPFDTDGDGVANCFDTDSDGDGCSDVLESGGLDPNGDGILGAIPTMVDSDGLVIGSSPATGGYDGANGNEIVATQVNVTAMEPADQTATTGESATFTIMATADNSTGFTAGVPDYGTPGNANAGINYMWYIGDPDTSGTLITAADTNYSGENTNALTVNDVTGLDATEYFVVVTHDDNVCFTETRSAILTIAESDVSIDKVLVDSSPYLVGDTVTYILTVSNAGPDGATNVVVTDIPENLTITNVSGGGCTAFPCTIASIAAGVANDVTITVTATIDSEGAFSNGATVEADQDDPNTANNQDLSTDANNQGAVPSVPPVVQNDVSAPSTPGATVSLDPTADNGFGIDDDADGTLDVTSVSLVVPAGATMVQTDADGDIIGYTVPGEGVWEVNPVNGEISFAPVAGFNDDPTSPATYTIDDNAGNTSNQATVTIDYVPVATVDEITDVMPGMDAVIDVLANDVDGDLVDPTTVMIIDPANPGVPVTSLVEPGVGVWTVDPSSGAITFAPCTAAGIPDASCAGLFEGSPMDISYIVSDNEGNTTIPATVSAAYAVPPVAQNDVSTPSTPGATVSVDPTADNGFGVDADPDGTLDVTTVSLVVPAGATMVQTDADGDIIGYTVPGEGAWEVNPVTGEISFAPLAGFNDDPTNPASYTIDDNDGNPSNVATVTIDYVPVATVDEITGVMPGMDAVIDVLANDVDGDLVDPTTVMIIDPANPGVPVTSLVEPGVGVWTVNPSSGAITFAPCTAAGVPDASCTGLFEGSPMDIMYVVADDEGNVSDPATVSAAYAVPPVAQNDESLANTPGATVSLDPTADNGFGVDADPDGTLDVTSCELSSSSWSYDGTDGCRW